MFKGEKGITLVALVITIIVLLILAGVSISLVIGQNGVLSKATNAVSENEKANVEQDLKLAVADAEIAYYEAWVSNQSVEKSTYYAEEDYYTNNATNGTVTLDATNTDTTVVKGTYTVTNGGSYNFTVTIASGTVVVTPVSGS